MLMYWYTNIKKNLRLAILSTIGIASLLMSCESNDLSENVANKSSYFDIPDYFDKQIAELQKNNPLVLKTVYTNQVSEEKELKIADWKSELSSFLTVDLNKPAYQGSILKDSVDNTVNYRFTSDKADISNVSITYENNIPTLFRIEKQTKNFLYKTDEILIYQPHKMYSINKSQKVILLGANDYEIKGEIK